ncbi:MAG: hypothetical protein GY950_13010, partial [bacterium]|nr:hypothetical protein [bacterium]
GKKKLFYRKCKNRTQTETHPHYELLEYLCDIPHVIDGFQRLLDLKKFVKSHYENYDLKKVEKDRHSNDPPPAAGMDHVYLPLSGKTVRGLSWGMDWHKVARLEQIEGDETHLKKTGEILDFEVRIHFGFNQWSGSGLEYIAYSSPKASFLKVVREDITGRYGEPEKVVDFQGLARLLNENNSVFKDEKVLSVFLNEPDSHRFNRFVEINPQLTFRSALKWEAENTVILLFKKPANSTGERNGINHPYVLQFQPLTLFEFFEDCFAQLLIKV